MVNAFFKLIRWQNLLITALVFAALKYAVFEPTLKSHSVLYLTANKTLSFWQFLELMMSVIFITAGGYIINDLIDVEADQINKPEQNIIDKEIKSKNANIFYYLFTIVGIGLAVHLGMSIGNYKLAFVHLIAIALLYYYSTQLKHVAFAGNAIVALLSALVPLVYFIFEGFNFIQQYKSLLVSAYGTTIGGPMETLYLFSVGLALFAFLFTLLREITKDLEDQKGDEVVNSKTLPISLGIAKTKGIILLIGGLTIVWMLYILHVNLNIHPLKNTFFTFYVYLLIVIPTIYTLKDIWKAQNPEDFHKSSKMIKIIMIAGILTTIIYFNNI